MMCFFRFPLNILGRVLWGKESVNGEKAEDCSVRLRKDVRLHHAVCHGEGCGNRLRLWPESSHDRQGYWRNLGSERFGTKVLVVGLGHAPLGLFLDLESQAGHATGMSAVVTTITGMVICRRKGLS